MHTGFNSDASIIHVTPDVGQDLGLEAQLANGLAIQSRLFRGSGRGELDVLDTKCIESLGDSYFGLSVKEGIGELFTL
jgi:hypothetical protein